MSEPVLPGAPGEEREWRRLPLRALGPLTWPVLRAHWRWIIGGTAGGGWQLKNAMPAEFGAWVLPLLFVLLVVIITFLRWRNLRFFMSVQALHIRRGGLSRQETILEFARVQGLQVHQGLLLRLFRLFDVALETSGSETDAAHLPAASAEILDELRQHLRRDARHAVSSHAALHALAPDGAGAPAESADSGVVGIAGKVGAPGMPLDAGKGAAVLPAVAELHRLDRGDLLRMALTSMQTLAIGPLLLALLSRMQDHAIRQFIWLPLNGFFMTHLANWSEEYTKLAMLALGLLGSALLAVLWGTWRYGNYHLQQQAHEWHQQSGLVTPYAQTMNPVRTCGVIWSQNLLQSIFGRGWMRVAMVGDSGARRSSEDQLEGVSRAFRVPWLGYRKALRLQQQLFASQPFVLQKGARYQALAPQYMMRNRLQYLCLPLLLSFGGWWLLYGADGPGLRAAIGALLWLGLGEWLLRRRFASWRFAVAAHSLRLQRGVFSRSHTLLPWTAVQSVSLKQSSLDRFFKVARIELVAPFGRIALPCLSLADARVLFDYAAAQAIVPLARRY